MAAYSIDENKNLNLQLEMLFPTGWTLNPK